LSETTEFTLYHKLAVNIEYKIEQLKNSLVYGTQYKEGDVQRIRGQIMGYETSLKILKEALDIA
tara:strand:- start:86 stop:277 length:192 start_codon:yes stop_codon:yes gene_type:complete